MGKHTSRQDDNAPRLRRPHSHRRHETLPSKTLRRRRAAPHHRRPRAKALGRVGWRIQRGLLARATVRCGAVKHHRLALKRSAAGHGGFVVTISIGSADGDDAPAAASREKTDDSFRGAVELGVMGQGGGVCVVCRCVFGCVCCTGREGRDAATGGSVAHPHFLSRGEQSVGDRETTRAARMNESLASEPKTGGGGCGGGRSSRALPSTAAWGYAGVQAARTHSNNNQGGSCFGVAASAARIGGVMLTGSPVRLAGRARAARNKR